MKEPKLLKESLERIIEVDKEEDIVKKAKRMLKDLRSGDKVCKLRKAFYGLRQAGRQWRRKLHTTLESLNLKATNLDPCLYVDLQNNHRTYVLVYMDDMICSSDLRRVILSHGVSRIRKSFSVRW